MDARLTHRGRGREPSVKKGGTAGFTPALSDETERAGVFLLHRDFFGIFCNKNALHENA